MASIINSISFNNFFNYYGSYEDNRYDLEKGTNIIVADNGAGKSKFFNAFLWLFEDQILDSDDKARKNIKNVCVKIISDKAKNETAIHDSVNCGIQVEYTFGTRYKYQITKSFTATRLGESITDEDSWQFIMNDVEVNRSELILHRYKPVYDLDEQKAIINTLIMPSFRKYSFLQGEEVDKIIDFTNKSSIEDAVKNLTDIRKYEKLEELTKIFKIKAEKDLDKQNKTSSDQSQRLKFAIEKNKEIQEDLEREESKLKEFNTTYELAELEKVKLDRNYANAEKRKELDDHLKDANRLMRETASDYEDYLEKINSKFFDGNFSWIAMGFNEVVNDFQKLNDNFIDQRYAKKALLEIEDNPNNYFHFLPVNSPDVVSLKNMIDKEHCYVCDRPAKYGTHEHNYLLKLKERPTGAEKTKSFVKNDFKNFFGDIQMNAQPFYNKIDSIPESVKSVKERVKHLESRLKKRKDVVKSLKDQRKDILIAGVDSDTSHLTILNEYKGALKRMNDSEYKIDLAKQKIVKYKKDIINIDNEIESLNKFQDIPQGYKDNYSILKDLAESSEGAKNRVYDNMIKVLEMHANNHFKHLIANNDLAGGILKFEKSPSGSISFNYLDKQGNVVHGSSEGFQRMKKFSVVMAIISANTTQFNYPLLADAPISAFGEGFTEGFFEATGKVFPQSIILVKELYKSQDERKINELGKRLLKDDDVKTMYVNQVTEGAEQIDLVTTKIKLK